MLASSLGISIAKLRFGIESTRLFCFFLLFFEGFSYLSYRFSSIGVSANVASEENDDFFGLTD